MRDIVGQRDARRRSHVTGDRGGAQQGGSVVVKADDPGNGVNGAVGGDRGSDGCGQGLRRTATVVTVAPLVAVSATGAEVDVA